jgi:predicted permease
MSRHSFATRAYRTLLRLLPFEFRAEFGEEMEGTFEEQRQDTAATERRRGLARLWLRTIADFLRTAPCEHWDLLRQDLRFGLRMLARDRGFAAVAVATLAIGIGASTAIFAAADGMLLRPLPFPDSGRLVAIWKTDPPRFDRMTLSYEQFAAIRARCPAFEEVATYAYGETLQIPGGDVRVRLLARDVSASLLRALRAPVVLGRSLVDADERPGAPPVVVITHGLWVRRFGGSRAVVGQTLLQTVSGRLNPISATIVGVLGSGFAFPYPNPWPADAWIPLTRERNDSARNSRAYFLPVVGRLRRGAGLDTAQAQLDLVASQLARSWPEYKGEAFRVARLSDDIAGPLRVPLLAFLGGAGLLLLIACANVANLLLARAIAREGEFAIRISLGAGRLRVVRQLLVEGFLLAGVAAILGLLVAQVGVRAFLALAPEGFPRLGEVAIDYRVLLFAIGVATCSAMAFSLVPAVRCSRAGSMGALGRAAGSGGSSRTWRRPLGVVVIAELATALVLLVCGGLLVRSFVGLVQVDLGFDPAGVVAFEFNDPKVTPPPGGGRRLTVADSQLPVVVLSDGARQTLGFTEELQRRVAALPGVVAVGFVNNSALSGRSGQSDIHIQGRSEPADGKPLMADVRSASPGYFTIMRMRLKAGRWFDDRDREGAPRVAIVNEAMARRFWPGQDAIGKGVSVGRTPASRIVGVVADPRHNGPGRPPLTEIYVPHLQRPWSYTLVVRTAGTTAGLPAGVSRETRALGGAIVSARELEHLFWQSIAIPRLVAFLAAVFAVVGVVLAAVGVHSVLRYSTARRIREMGIRLALGAQPGQVVGLVLRQAIGLGVLGLALGALGAAAAVRVIRSLLFTVTPSDTLTWVAVSALLIVAVVVAALGPARRAGRVDPVVSLRAE